MLVGCPAADDRPETVAGLLGIDLAGTQVLYTLADAIEILKMLSDLSVQEALSIEIDINADRQVGIEEAVYLLQYLAEIR